MPPLYLLKGWDKNRLQLLMEHIVMLGWLCCLAAQS